MLAAVSLRNLSKTKSLSKGTFLVIVLGDRRNDEGFFDTKRNRGKSISYKLRALSFVISCYLE